MNTNLAIDALKRAKRQVKGITLAAKVLESLPPIDASVIHVGDNQIIVKQESLADFRKSTDMLEELGWKRVGDPEVHDSYQVAYLVYGNTSLVTIKIGLPTAIFWRR